MRVLHLDSGRTMGGGQWQVLRLIQGLQGEGVESTLLAREGSPLFLAAKERGWNVDAFGMWNALRERGHDLTHAHDARGHTVAALAGGGRLVVSRRVAFPVKSQWKYRHAERYIAVSETVQAVLEAGGVERDRVSVVADGVPLLEPARGTYVLSLSKGAAMASKGAQLAGEELRISTDLEHDLLHAGIFVYVTECEGLGSGVLLAMSAGVPVIASNVGGVREIVEQEQNGLLVENRPQAIADAIQRLRGNPDLAARLAAAGRQTVIERFTVEQMVRRTMDVYRMVLA